MDNLFRSKWFVRVISLFFAVLLYVFVVDVDSNFSQDNSRYTASNSEEIERVEDMPVKIKMDDEKYVVSGVPETVAVSLEGTVSLLRPTAIQKNFDVYVDLTNLSEGEHRVEIEYGDLPKGLKAYIEPKTIDVTIEERATETFTVRADFINEDKMPTGFELGDYQVEPETVTITSSKSVIEQIALVKVFVDMTDVQESINKREVPVNVYDNQGNELDVFIEPETAVVSVDVKQSSKKVSLEVMTEGELPNGLTLDSIKPDAEEVEVFAKSDRLEELTKIETEPIKLDDINQSGELDVQLKPPEDTDTADKEVSVEIELNQKKTFKEVPINIKNVANNKKATIKGKKNSTIELEVSGNERDLRNLTKEDFTIEVDASSLANGEHSLPIKVDGPSGIKVKPKESKITIVISDN